MILTNFHVGIIRYFCCNAAIALSIDLIFVTPYAETQNFNSIGSPQFRFSSRSAAAIFAPMQEVPKIIACFSRSWDYVRQILIYEGNSYDIMYVKLFEKLGLKKKKLYPRTSSNLHAFNGILSSLRASCSLWYPLRKEETSG